MLAIIIIINITGVVITESNGKPLPYIFMIIHIKKMNLWRFVIAYILNRHYIKILKIKKNLNFCLRNMNNSKTDLYKN